MRATSALALLVCLVSASLAPAALASNTITGTVRNQSRGQAAGGCEVILLRLDRGMQEEARAKTDADGKFSFTLRSPEKPYLARVVYQNVNYDEEASAGSEISIQVFDAAAHVTGISGSIEILRAGTRGRVLHVSDMYEIRNDSSPALTQAGERTFEVYLPPNARVDSVLAAGPGRIGVMISAVPVPDDPRHYSVNFPLRPGATKFAFNYDLPYDGHVAFHTRREYSVQQLAVMIPSTMKFSAGSPGFEILAAGNSNYQVRAASQLRAGSGPGFEISGQGPLPPIRSPAKIEAQSRAAVLPGTEMSVPARMPPHPPVEISSRPQKTSPTRRLPIWIGSSSIFLAACSLIVWRLHRARIASARRSVAPSAFSNRPSAILLAGLKDQLFQLEADRMRGTVSGEDYSSARQALDETIKRALARSSQQKESFHTSPGS